MCSHFKIHTITTFPSTVTVVFLGEVDAVITSTVLLAVSFVALCTISSGMLMDAFEVENMLLFCVKINVLQKKCYKLQVLSAGHKHIHLYYLLQHEIKEIVF